MQSLFSTIQINGFKNLLRWDLFCRLNTALQVYIRIYFNVKVVQKVRIQDLYSAWKVHGTVSTDFSFHPLPTYLLDPFGICAIYFDLKVLPKLRILLCHPAGGRRTSLLHQGAESHGTRLVRQQRHRSATLHVRCTENKTCSFGLDDFKVAWQRMITKIIRNPSIDHTI